MSSISEFVNNLHFRIDCSCTLHILFHSESKITLFHLLSLVFIRFHLLYHSLSFVVIRCYSLSFVVTRCHSLSLNVPLVYLFINDPFFHRLVVSFDSNPKFFRVRISKTRCKCNNATMVVHGLRKMLEELTDYTYLTAYFCV